MKLNKWPEEIEVDGWRWKRFDSNECKCPDQEDRYYNAQTFYKVKKLHVAPTHREIMQHLLRDGVVVEESGDTEFHYRIGAKSELEVSMPPYLDWNPACLCLGPARGIKFYLLKGDE